MEGRNRTPLAICDKRVKRLLLLLWWSICIIILKYIVQIHPQILDYSPVRFRLANCTTTLPGRAASSSSSQAGLQRWWRSNKGWDGVASAWHYPTLVLVGGCCFSPDDDDDDGPTIASVQEWVSEKCCRFRVILLFASLPLPYWIQIMILLQKRNPLPAPTSFSHHISRFVRKRQPYIN